MIDIRQEDVKDYLDWTKLLITINSAAVGTLLVKFDASSPPSLPIQIGAVCFLLSLVALLVSYTGLVEHQRESQERTNWKTSGSLMFSWATFLAGFGSLVFNLSLV
ncbi:hypothetical protein [Halomonas salinarum]|uniref:hypothetical protein n=1 Tax=Halomonas salinarum TaxID=1158993 RepID=UPI00143B7769|nr:hypothetical protein [Halomonas salinarum]